MVEMKTASGFGESKSPWPAVSWSWNVPPPFAVTCRVADAVCGGRLVWSIVTAPVEEKVRPKLSGQKSKLKSLVPEEPGAIVQVSVDDQVASEKSAFVNCRKWSA